MVGSGERDKRPQLSITVRGHEEDEESAYVPLTMCPTRAQKQNDSSASGGRMQWLDFETLTQCLKISILILTDCSVWVVKEH